MFISMVLQKMFVLIWTIFRFCFCSLRVYLMYVIQLRWFFWLVSMKQRIVSFSLKIWARVNRILGEVVLLSVLFLVRVRFRVGYIYTYFFFIFIIVQEVDIVIIILVFQLRKGRFEQYRDLFEVSWLEVVSRELVLGFYSFCCQVFLFLEEKRFQGLLILLSGIRLVFRGYGGVFWSSREYWLEFQRGYRRLQREGWFVAVLGFGLIFFVGVVKGIQIKRDFNFLIQL